MSNGGPAVRSALRRLLRAQRKAFQGDGEMQRVAVSAIMEQFRSNASAAADEEIGQMLKMADDAVEFLGENVVQNALSEDGHYVLDKRAVKVEGVGVRRPGD